LPETAITVYRKGDVVRAERAANMFTGRINAIMSNGTVKLAGLDGAFSTMKMSMVSRREGILFVPERNKIVKNRPF